MKSRLIVVLLGTASFACSADEQQNVRIRPHVPRRLPRASELEHLSNERNTPSKNDLLADAIRSRILLDGDNEVPAYNMIPQEVLHDLQVLGRDEQPREVGDETAESVKATEATFERFLAENPNLEPDEIAKAKLDILGGN